MKTNIHIRHAETLEDIVFENRNKAYGAYRLNRHKDKYLFIAFLITLFCISTAFTIVLMDYSQEDYRMTEEKIIPDIVLSRIDQSENLTFEIPNPKTGNLLKQTEYTAPVVVAEVTLDEPITTMAEILKSTRNEEVQDQLLPVVEEFPITDEKNEEKPFLFVEEPASFQGGSLDEFHSWITANIQYPTKAIENEISGRVFVQFCINTEGKLTDLKITRGLDASINNEIIRILESSPVWTPARQGGMLVKQLYSMSVVFNLENASNR